MSLLTFCAVLWTNHSSCSHAFDYWKDLFMKPVPFNISHKRYYLGSYALGAVRHPRCVTADYTVSSEKRGLSEPAKNKKGCSAIKGWAEIQKRLCGNINHKKHARGHSRKLCQSATHQYNGGLWKEGDRKRMVDTVLVPTASWLTTSSRCFFKMGCCLWLAGDRPEKCLEITTNKKHLWRTVPSHPSSVVQSMYLVPVENGRNYSSEDPSELSLWPRRNTGSTCVVSMRDFRVQLLAQAQEKKYPFPESYEGLRY